MEMPNTATPTEAPRSYMRLFSLAVSLIPSLRPFLVLSLAASLIVSLAAHGKTIAVIGGGLAGLTAAYELQKQIDSGAIDKATELVVFEARARPGGRVFTVKLNGLPAELGGENINDGGEAPNIRQLAADLKLKVLSRPQPPTARYFFDPVTGQHHAINELKAFFPKIDKKRLVADLAAAEKGASNISQVLDRFFAKYPARGPEEKRWRPLIRKVIEEAMRSYEGGAVQALSSRYAHGSLIDMMSPFLDRPPKTEGYPSDSIEGGNSQLVLTLAKSLGTKLQLASPLTDVSRATDGSFEFKLGGANPKTVHADVLLLALPCKPYAAIRFGDGTLDRKRLGAIASVAYGTHAKILVPTPLRSDRASLPLPSTPGALVWRHADESWFTVYFTGPAGVMRTQAELQRGFQLAAHAMPPDSMPMLTGEITVPEKIFAEYKTPVAMSWTTDPFTQGSYSYYTPGMRQQLETAIEVDGEKVLPLFAPVGDKIFFAGEHTTVNQDIRGTMEAAVESGYRASRLIRQALTRKPKAGG